MRKTIFFLILLLILLVPTILSVGYMEYLTKAFADTLYCSLTGCTMEGDLNQSKGNTTVNLIYGEMFNYSSHSSPYTFDILGDNIYYNLTGLVEGNLNGFSFSTGNQASGGSKLTAQVAGLYKVCSSMSFLSNNVGGTFGIGIVENYDVTLHRDCYSRREASIQIGSVGVCCLMDLDVGDIVNIQVENEDNTRDMIIHTVNLNLFRIGN